MAMKIEVFVEIVHETPNALLVDAGLGELVWIPKSVLLDLDPAVTQGWKGELEIPEWLAAEKGLV